MLSPQRFWARFERQDDGCLIWQGNRPGGRYGHIKVDRKTLLVHKVAYELSHGPIPDGLWVLHKCDNTGCGEPTHLFLGTGQDNRMDMIEKGRYGFGELHGMAKLTEDEVRQIRMLHVPFSKKGDGSVSNLARKFGVNRMTIHRVVTGANWKRLD